ncbi:phenylacetaldoxime dehydratase family protein [Microbulbifer echini]|uniref:Phenylacetaldoxime dehydratase family protein n=1 Tax=Microbulbifer echini TaxID=1529067 RepID=A0ABV4NK42_9GAMM
MTQGKCGVWYEALAAPRSHFEVSSSLPTADWGLFRHFETCTQRDHAYWGAMRDRIAAAENNGLPGQLKKLKPLSSIDQSSEEISLPENICMIRTVQGYSVTSSKERRSYEEKLRPKYEQGVRFLDENPMKSRCLSVRLLRDEKPMRGRPDTETIAWFASLVDLENWVHHHRTHKAIYTAAQQHAVCFSPEMHLLLSHEVAVVPKGKGKAMYKNCHPDTGLTRFLS